MNGENVLGSTRRKPKEREMSGVDALLAPASCREASTSGAVWGLRASGGAG